MSAVKFCDKCHKPFSANQVGSQSISAITIVMEGSSLSSTNYPFDLCAADAIRAQEPEFLDTPEQTALEK